LASRRELVIVPKVPRARLAAFAREAIEAGATMVYADPAALDGARVPTMHTSPSAGHVVLEGTARARRARGKKAGRRFRILSNRDIEDVLEAASAGLDFVIVDVKDWRIIPLENVIAKLHSLNTRIFASARTPAEVRKMFSILEVGVDGVIFTASSAGAVRKATTYLGSRRLALEAARVTDVREVGDGERVCVDTASMLGAGEGMLVGSRSNFMFLVHNESVGSSFTSPRPFRVNAGAVHCYTSMPDGTTSYLSELESGSEILVMGRDGNARRATVGRSKIERRPMLLITAEARGASGGIIAQDAETIRFVRPDGRLVSVTHLRRGDSVMVHSVPARGRHFGMEVAGEYILEK